jgi:hypothetical protein
MSNIDRVLEDELRRQAARLPLPAGDLPGVMARTRRRRQHRMMAAATTFAVVAATVTGVALSRDGSSRQVKVGVAATNPVVRLGETGIHWQRSDPHSALGYAFATSAAGSLYALSTAPGVAQVNGPNTALYTSADGIEWTTAAAPTDLSLAAIAATGNRLYVVGTGTATASVAAAKVGWSDDKSGVWHQTALPIDTAAISAKASTLNGEIVKIAAGPKGVVAVATISTVLDIPKLLPAGVSAPNGWALSDTGVDLLGTGPVCPAGTTATPPLDAATARKAGLAAAAESKDKPAPGQVSKTPCFTGAGKSYTLVSPQATRGVTASYTWSQLSVSGDLLQAVLGEPFVFFSADGTSFKRVAPGVSNIRSNLFHVSADGTGFALLAQNESGTTSVFHSADGQQWQQDPSLPADLSDVTAAGTLGGRMVVVGNSSSDPGSDGSVTPMVATLDGGHWTESSLSAVLGSSADPKPTVEAAAVGPLGVAVAIGGSTSTEVLFSQDGTTWSVQPLSQFVRGGSPQVTSVVVTANRAVVTVEMPDSTKTGPAPSVVVVGTPA